MLQLPCSQLFDAETPWSCAEEVEITKFREDNMMEGGRYV